MQLSNGGCNVVCPHCSTTIYADASMVDQQSLEPIWYYAVNDQSVGPISARDIEFSFQKGDITLDSYIWREGLSDWMPLSAVPEFDYLLTPVSGSPYGGDEATRIGEGANAAYSGFSTFGTQGGEETAAIDINAYEAQNGFSPFDNNNVGGIMGMDGREAHEDPAPAHTSEPKTNPVNDMVGGQQGESSVLFSLSSLQAASSTPASGPSAVGSSSEPMSVTALAANTPSPRRSLAKPNESRHIACEAPMSPIMPLGTKKDNKPLIIGIIAVAVVLIFRLVALVVFMGGEKNNPKQQSANVNLEQVEQTAAGVKAPSKPQPAPDTGNALAQPQNDAPAAPKKDDGKDENQPLAAANNAPSQQEQTQPKEPVEDKNPAKANTAPKTDTPKKADTPKKPTQNAPAPAANNKLGKDEVQSVIRGSFANIRSCSRTSQKKGKMNVSFVIKGDGRVGNARVTSPEFANTPVASCVLKVVNGMKFRATGGTDTPITYPFQIQ